MKRSIGLSLALLLIDPAGVFAQGAAQLLRIGAAAAVKGRVEALAPTAGAAGRILGSGQTVYSKDKVTTDAAGRMQILLLDETTFTIGPNSAMVLDEFVYDPATGGGKVTASISKGVFRFVTGRIAKNQPSNMKVKLPTGTIGIRGTMVAGRVDPSGNGLVVLLGPGPRSNVPGEKPGEVSVSNAGESQNLSQPGFGVKLEAGKAPSAPFPVPPAQLSEVTNALAPQPTEGSKEESSGGGGSDGKGETKTADSSPSSGGGSASEQSGDTTASGGQSLNDTQSTASLGTNLGQSSTQASQDSAESGSAIVDGIAKWRDVKSVTTGTGFFNGSGSGTCSGGPCLEFPSISIAFQIDIDFGNRYVGGGSSFLSFTGSGSGTHSTNITPATFYSGQPDADDAIITLSAPSNSSNLRFNGTLLKLKNDAGVAAKKLGVELNFNDGAGMTATGSALGSR